MRREKAPDNFSQCRKCGARIIFVRMKSGKSMPVNPNFVNFRRDGGKDRIVLANGEVTSGTIVMAKEIKAAAEPLRRFLEKYYDPTVEVVVDTGVVTVKRGEYMTIFQKEEMPEENE